MYRRFLLLALPILFLALLPPAAHACAEPGSYYPPVTWTTHIESISPQVGIAGITQVDIEGYCFGDTQGTGTVTVNGVPMTIEYWSDAEIILDLPFDATTGDLKVTSANYGSDDSLGESACTCSGCPSEGWPASSDPPCGNNLINADFQVSVPSNPPLCCNENVTPPAPYVAGSPSPSQYVEGTWDYNQGGFQAQFTLTQGPQNSKTGLSLITGTEVNTICSQVEQVTGFLDQLGDMELSEPCLGHCIEWHILGSGDVTSQGLELGGASLCSNPPYANFPNDGLMDEAEGAYYNLGVPPLFKSQTDQPASETPAPDATPWSLGPPSAGSLYKTYGRWDRTLPLSPDGFNEFAGRFVYEQSGGAATDGCYAALPNTHFTKVTSVTSGGGWYVNTSSVWGVDIIGIKSQAVSFYQEYYAIPASKACEITGPQAMHIDARTGPSATPYTTNTLMPADIASNSFTVGVQPSGSTMVKKCEPYSYTTGVGKGKCH